ncbi:hypothetical protein CANARDRAFT_87126 [[Candida] arabinofermentans NRRL YB-2248]|uniref:Histone transcription regulator 3 homolog n=1 Tax=[Candida] arabinofermentans NRRL YB-2248 TaxID=983967 RepID=A0A1E4T639_9ASCO|nr:hypothetical protein CANARDRAFT_87126 [[Candida] arabinofermentans NRRL YB-2248]
MSSFTAINQNVDDYDIEEHTREMQIEYSFKIFEEALKYQRLKDYDRANSKYDVLFKIQVTKEENLSGSPTIENLKYLSYRNRGFLKLSELIKDCEHYHNEKSVFLKNKERFQLDQPDKQITTETVSDSAGNGRTEISDNSDDEEEEQKEEWFERLMSAIDDLITSLVHGRADLKLIDVLSQICNHYKLQRLSRLLIEFEFLKSGSGLGESGDSGMSALPDDDLCVDLKNAEFLLPNQVNLLRNYKETLDQLYDVESIEYQSLQIVLDRSGGSERLDKKQRLKLDMVLTKFDFDSFRTFENDTIKLTLYKYDDKIDLRKFLKDVNDILPRLKGKSKVYDNYVLSEFPIEKIILDVVEKKVETIEEVNTTEPKKRGRKKRERRVSSEKQLEDVEEKQVQEEDQEELQKQDIEEVQDNVEESKENTDERDTLHPDADGVEINNESQEETENGKENGETEAVSISDDEMNVDTDNVDHPIDTLASSEANSQNYLSNVDDNPDQELENEHQVADRDPSDNRIEKLQDSDVIETDFDKAIDEDTDRETHIGSQTATAMNEDPQDQTVHESKKNVDSKSTEVEESDIDDIKEVVAPEVIDLDTPIENEEPEVIPRRRTGIRNAGGSTTGQRATPKRLTRAKVDAEVINIEDVSFGDQERFVSTTFPNYIKLCGIEAETHDLVRIATAQYDSEVVDSTGEKNQIFVEFAANLENWHSQQTDCLMVKLADENSKGKDTKDKEVSIKEILSSGIVEANLEDKGDQMELDSGDMLELVEKINDTRPHLNQIRMMILQYLFNYDESNGGCFLTNVHLSKDTLKNINILIDAVGLYLLKELRNSVMCCRDLDNETAKSALGLSVAILELLIDATVEIRLELKLKKTTNKSVLNELQSSEELMFARVEDWCNLVDDYFGILDEETQSSEDLSKLWIRYNWARVCFLQHTPDFDTDYLSSVLTDMSRKAEALELEIPMVNYEAIPRLSKSSIAVQLSKMRIFKTFTNDDQSNTILEQILGDDDDVKATYNEEQKEMDYFISRSPIGLKLRLWCVLFSHYEEANLIEKYQSGFQKVMKLMLAELKVESIDAKTRSQLLLRVLGFFGLITEKFLMASSKHGWKLYDQNTQESLKDAIEFFKICYIFLIHEDVVVMTNRKKSIKASSIAAYNRLSEITVISFTLLSIYFEMNLIERKPESLNDFYGTLHEQLGVRKMCNKLDGIFLGYVETKLVEMNWSDSENDFFQTIHCHYATSISTDTFSTFDHGVKPSNMNRSNAINVSKYILDYCFKKKHPIFNAVKTDIKSVLDLCYDVIGDPDMNTPLIAKNAAVLEELLEHRLLDVRLVKFAFYGLLNIDIEIPEMDVAASVEKGLYFLQGVSALTLFKIRKRSMQGRSAELDFVIKMFESDLICGTNRFETWLLLGQTYSYLVEDDIIWTSDKLNNDDKKRNTALFQKKSLLCYVMAINVFANSTDEQKHSMEPLCSILWSSFGKELYSAVTEPMSKLAFSNLSMNSLTSAKQDIFSEEDHATQLTPISTASVFKILLICFKQATKFSPKDWLNFYYLGKIQSKPPNNHNPEASIRSTLKSCQLAFKASSKDDPVIEPHYFLCSLVYKMVRRGNLSISKGLELLAMDPLLKSQELESINDMIGFGQAVITSLKKCVAYDKKNWQHKPRYRIAKIYFDQFNDFETAKKEMGSIINLKPNVRNLSSIWKPENERPGKHFVYNYDYISFYVQILTASNDLYSLIHLIRKLRKLGSSMINQVKIFDIAVLNTCTRIKKTVRIKKNFIDETLTKMIYSEFTAGCKKFVKRFDEKKEYTNEEKLILFFLNEVSDFRRMANGFGATGVIDDCYHSLFLVLYLQFMEKESKAAAAEEAAQLSAQQQTDLNGASDKQFQFVSSDMSFKKAQPGTPTREKVRVARRDITPYCVQLLGYVQNLISELKKDASEGKCLEFTVPTDNDDDEQESRRELMEASNQGDISTLQSQSAVSPKQSLENRQTIDGDTGMMEVDTSSKTLQSSTTLEKLSETPVTPTLSSVPSFDQCKVPETKPPEDILPKTVGAARTHAESGESQKGTGVAMGIDDIAVHQSSNIGSTPDNVTSLEESMLTGNHLFKNLPSTTNDSVLQIAHPTNKSDLVAEQVNSVSDVSVSMSDSEISRKFLKNNVLSVAPSSSKIVSTLSRENTNTAVIVDEVDDNLGAPDPIDNRSTSESNDIKSNFIVIEDEELDEKTVINSKKADVTNEKVDSNRGVSETIMNSNANLQHSGKKGSGIASPEKSSKVQTRISDFLRFAVTPRSTTSEKEKNETMPETIKKTSEKEENNTMPETIKKRSSSQSETSISEIQKKRKLSSTMGSQTEPILLDRDDDDSDMFVDANEDMYDSLVVPHDEPEIVIDGTSTYTGTSAKDPLGTSENVVVQLGKDHDSTNNCEYTTKEPRPSRRSTRRSITSSTLLELDKGGQAKKQYIKSNPKDLTKVLSEPELVVLDSEPTDIQDDK